MPTKVPVKYTDNDLDLYERRKQFYMSMGYEANEDSNGIGKVCTLVNKNNAKVILTLISE